MNEKEQLYHALELLKVIRKTVTAKLKPEWAVKNIKQRIEESGLIEFQSSVERVQGR